MALHPDARDNFSQTGTAINAGATSLNVAQTGAAAVQYAITHLSGSTDVSGNLLLYDGAVAAANVRYQVKIPANSPFQSLFDEPVVLTAGNAATARIDSGSIAVSLNLVGYRISNA